MAAASNNLFDIVNSPQFEDEILNELEQALTNGADINAKDAQGWTVLHRTIIKNQLNVVKFLVQNGADINIKNESGQTASILAARFSNWSILKFLIEERGAKIPIADERNRDQVEATIRRLRNPNVFSILNDQTQAVLVLGEANSTVDILTHYLAKFDQTCECLIGEESTSSAGDVSYPTVIADAEEEIAYFGSIFASKTSPEDIAQAFFQKKIIDLVDDVKIIFSLSYDTITNQADLLDFVSSAANFIVDAGKFARSVGLVVTKFDKDGASDSHVLAHVGNALKELQEYVKTKMAGENINLLHLLGTFLTQSENDGYVYLGVLKVSKMPEKILSKYYGPTAIKVVENTWFASKGEDGFRFLISENSKLLVYDLIERINLGVTFDVIDVATDFKKYYQNEVKHATNLHRLQKKLDVQFQSLSKMMEEITLMADPMELSKSVIRNVDEMKISLSGSNLKSISLWGYCMEFLQMAAGQTYQTNPGDWIKSLKEVSEYLDDTNKWYDFLLDLYEKFSTYEIQKDKKKYNVADLNNWGIANVAQGIAINRSNWEKFILILEPYHLKHYHHVKNLSVDKLKLNDLNHVLDLSFKKLPQQSCQNFKRIAKGNYVFLSELFKVPCYKNAYFEVFALNKVFIDMDLNQCNLKGIIVAPNWSIHGSRILGLRNEGQFVGISQNVSDQNPLNFYFTKGASNLNRINLISNGTDVLPHLATNAKIFTTSLACVEAKRLASLDQISYNIEDYKSYLRENLNDNVQQQTLIDFVGGFDNSTTISNLYDSLGFVRELQKLEDHYYNLSQNVDFLPFYESFLRRLTKYSEKAPNDVKTKTLLSYVYTAVLSKVTNLKYGTNSNLIVDIKEYLDLVFTNIKELGEIERKTLSTREKFNEINKRAMIGELREEYANEILKKIQEANYFIDQYILPEIKNISDQLVNEVGELLKEIDEVIEQVERRKEELEKLKKKVEREIRLRAALGILKVFGTLLSFLGPIGSAIGTVITVGASIGEAFIPDSSEKLNTLDQITLPEGIDVERVLRKREIIDFSTISLNNFEILRIGFAQESQNATVTDVERSLGKREAIMTRYMRKRDATDALSATGDSITSLINNAKSDEQKLEIIKNAIRECEEQIEKLEEFKSYVRNKVTPWLKGVTEGLQTQAKNLKGKSHAALDISRWNIQQKIRDLKFALVDATKGFKVQRNFKRCVEKIDDALNTLVNVFDRIQHYEDQKRLAVYIADINLVQFDDHNIVDVKLMNTTVNLERIITSNILLGYYDTAVNNFKQFAFPFADYFLEDFSLLSVLSENGDVQTIVDNAARRVGLMKSALTLSSTTINKHFDKHLHKAYFNSENTVVGPFYVWNQNEHKEAIGSLLKGEEVALKADVVQTTSEKNAVKFDFIELQFKTMNSSKQAELDAKLKFFEITMTHLGNSYYRCGSKFYIINTDSVTITYSLQKGEDGKPISANVVYEKLRRGDLLLSPYTMWTVKLTPTTLPFKELRQFAREINLVLIGHGQYLTKNSDVCDHDLPKYYQIDETLSDVHAFDAHAAQLIQNSDDQYTCASSASKSNSPINNLAKIAWSYFPNSIIDTYINPIEFYNQVDSTLLLAPIFVHLWNSFFNKKIQDVPKMVEVSKSKVSKWERILGQSQNLLALLKKMLGSNHAELVWYEDVLRHRLEAVEMIKVNYEATMDEVDDLEKNLSAFVHDLGDDLDYDPAFGGVRNNATIRSVVKRLVNAVGRRSDGQNIEFEGECLGRSVWVQGVGRGSVATSFLNIERQACVGASGFLELK